MVSRMTENDLGTLQAHEKREIDVGGEKRIPRALAPFEVQKMGLLGELHGFQDAGAASKVASLELTLSNAGLSNFGNLNETDVDRVHQFDLVLIQKLKTGKLNLTVPESGRGRLTQDLFRQE